MPTSPKKLTNPEFQEAYTLPDWRILQRTIQATFRASSFSAAASFLPKIAEAADALDHHPDVDLRYPGRLRITLTTHASKVLTSLDAELAARISALADEAGLTSEPTSATRTEIAIDALDIATVRPFWRAVMNYVDGGDEDLVDPLRIGPAIWFQQMDEPRPDRSRIHIDVLVAEDEAEARVAAAIAAGGVLLTDIYARSFWVLADAEGNEACVCTWQDRE